MSPGEAAHKSQLAAAARNITASLNALLDVCVKSSPGQKECDNAVRTMQARFLACLLPPLRPGLSSLPCTG